MKMETHFRFCRLCLIISFIAIFALPNAFADFPTFREVTDGSGIRSAHRGKSASWGDYNNDGLVDLYICNSHSQPNALFQNLGNGQFKNVTAQAGVGGYSYSLCAWWLDLDADGYLDLFVVNLYYANKFYHNNRDGTFTERFHETSLSEGFPNWIDLNHDGLLDVYIARGNNIYPSPHNASNYFFYNKNNLKFENVTNQTFLQNANYNCYPNWNDYNDDGYADLFVINTAKNPHLLYSNNSDGTFSDVFYQSGIRRLNADNGWADLDQDGDQDLVLIENIGTNSFIYENVNRLPFREWETPIRLAEGLVLLEDFRLIDIDNDGLLDLVINVHKKHSQFDHSLRVYQNAGNFTFIDVTENFAFLQDKDLIHTAWGDYDNDGDFDFLAIHRRGLQLFQNNGTNNNYLRLNLMGTDGHPDGIGAKLTVATSKQTITRWVGAGQDYHWDLRNQLIVGIGSADSVQKITVNWPSGIVQDSLNPPINQEIRLTEPATNWFVDQTERAQLDKDVGKSMGGACADYNDDGHLDVYITNHLTLSILYENQGQAKFFNISQPARIPPNTTQIGALFFDYDNNATPDLFTVSGYVQGNSLLKNSGNGLFADVTRSANIRDDYDSCFSVITADFNNDGWLDIYQGHNGENKLLINSGKGFFNDETVRSGTGNRYLAHGMVAFDYDHDGDQDIYIANCRGGEESYKVRPWPNALYKNNGDLTFTDVAPELEIAFTANSKGVCAGDYDNDGDFDLYIANDDTLNTLLQNNGNGTFTDVTSLAGVSQPMGAHGCQFIDFDNDGDPDLYVSGSSYVPEKHDYSFNKLHPNVLYRNNGDGTFTDITRHSGIQNNQEQTPHIIVADFDKDGYVDILATNTYTVGSVPVKNTYFQNRCRGNNWLQVKLIGNKSNRDAIGSKVCLKADNLTIWQEVSNGCGFGCNRSTILQFGLGKHERIDKLIIYWPSGIIQKLNDELLIKQLITIEEPYEILGIIQISRKTLKFFGIGLIIFLFCAVGTTLLWFTIPLLQKGWKLTQEQKEENKVFKKFLNERHILEVRIDLMPYKGDYLLTHFIKPTSREVYQSNAFHWGRQETTPIFIRNEKVLALDYHFKNILNEHLKYIQDPDQLSTAILKELKNVGKKIFQYFGLRFFFENLFRNEQLKRFHLNIIVENTMIPWYLAFDEVSDKFLCETMPYSFSLRFEKSTALGLFCEPYPPQKSEKVGIILFGNWENHEKHLTEVENEVKELKKIFATAKLTTLEVDSSSENFVSAVQNSTSEGKNIRIIHYCGHIEYNTLAISPDDFLDPNYFEKAYGISFDSNPIIFLNGCQSTDPWDANNNLAKYFLKIGAAACVVTHAKIPEKTAKHFATWFYHYFIKEELTIAEALRKTRLIMAEDKKINSHFRAEYDVTRYLYNLFGDPLARF